MKITARHDTTLPIYNQRKEIEKTIANNPITILTAETGAGKSTGVPLWLWQRGQKVHVTQPRRIAARSLALYLAKITDKTLGQEVGYQTGFDSKQSRATRLLYVTDGVQMVREINGRRDYDVLVLDEIHEWNLNQDVLIGLVKRNLVRGVYRKKNKRVVIMSATLQAKRLSSFLGNAPIISVPGRGYPVAMHHNDPRFLLPDTAGMVEMERNVLVFQPGKQEILNFIDDLKRMLEAEKMKAKILPLHAELSLKEQSKVFDHYSLPKVIVATDIAQTSLTIDDIDAVVDSGIKKELRHVRGISGLYPVDISSAECMQRAGRAGRVRKGEYFLCADKGIEDRSPYPDAEILRLSLESVILRLIKMGLDPLTFPFFHAPAKALIFKGIKRLKLLGAITEEGAVTEDGKKMADLPVSLRSARLLLEAQKGSSKVLDCAIKCIAILETKGILQKDFALEKYANTPYHSDLLNQLVLWETARRNRQAVNQKKFTMAKEIYQELNKRLGITKPVKGGLTSKEFPMLYRAILSCFADEVYIRGGGEYQKDNDIRQLDRSSVLFASKPEMVTALPFDLIILRENRDTGDKEEAYIPLITFASELPLEVLEELKPFSYYKEETVVIEKKKVSIYRQIFFGGRMIREIKSPPIWDKPEESKQVMSKILEWFETNYQAYDIAPKMEQVAKDLETVRPLLDEKLKEKTKPFSYYWERFLTRELTEHLKMDDLDLFFKFHSGFTRVGLEKILPVAAIRELKRARWPQYVEIAGEQVKVLYIKRHVRGTPRRDAKGAPGGEPKGDSKGNSRGNPRGKPGGHAGWKAFIKMDYPFFEKVRENEVLLPTGERAGIILGSRRFTQWEHAVHQYNRWKKADIFEKKYKDARKPGHVDDMQDIPFPQAFEGGRGKDNTVFEFYMVPKVEGKEAFLVHFFEKESAEEYFQSHRQAWETFIRNFKKSKIETIFKQKGWKVKS